MTHRIRHGLDLEIAKKVAEKAIETYTAKYAEYNPSFKWTTPTSGDLSFSFNGTKLSGKVSIEGPDIVIDMKIPFLMKMFIGPAMKMVTEEVNKWVKAVKEGRIVL